ncbi:NIPSNAP family protein [Dokdonella sp.]|uniref:NIPSNAP family protein n=1 Tax=Dokdonella sp. TaxID=2291710 RepID=UPI002F3E2B99
MTRASPAWPVVELRQYTLHPGRRDALVELFEREFIEPQEACGMRLFGQFRDLDDPDRFVWLRGFADMERRAAALGAFYGGPVWKAHRDAANATMVDSDDVLLLRPLRTDGGFALDDALRGPIGTTPARARLVVALVWAMPRDAEPAGRLERDVAAWVARIEAAPLAAFVSEHAANTFPALPVRESEHVVVYFAAFDDDAHWLRHRDGLAAFAPEPLQVLRLAPTARSLVR